MHWRSKLIRAMGKYHIGVVSTRQHAHPSRVVLDEQDLALEMYIRVGRQAVNDRRITVGEHRVIAEHRLRSGSGVSSI